LTRILFWNVNRKKLTPIIASLAISTMADVIVLNENPVSADEVLGELRRRVSGSFFEPECLKEGRFHCFCRQSRLSMKEVHYGTRESYRELNLASCSSLLVLFHGLDVRNNDIETRQSFIERTASSLRFLTEHKGNSRVIILGDFNMNPFDRPMNLASGFNAMMTRQCAQMRQRRHNMEEYDLYYNPMWGLFGDNTEGPPGTVYDASNQGPYGWSMFDQVLIHHYMIDYFEKIQIVTHAENQSLMNASSRPNANDFSDHFPILLTLKEVIDAPVLA